MGCGHFPKTPTNRGIPRSCDFLTVTLQYTMATNPITVKETPQFCQEGDSCDGRTSASLFCVDCGTFQCENCCTLLHIPKSQEHHRRFELAETPCRQFCEGKHTATTHCVSCEKAMCVACDRKTHTASREGHHRFSFQRPRGRTDRSGASDGEDAADNLFSSAVGHGIESRSSTSEPLGASMEEESQQYSAVKLINNKEELTVSITCTHTHTHTLAYKCNTTPAHCTNVSHELVK